VIVHGFTCSKFYEVDRFATMCDWLSFGAMYARNGRSISGQQILTEEWISMTTSPSPLALHGVPLI
jgi:hypothetical protein